LIENVQSNTKQNKISKEEVSYDNSVKAPMLGTLYHASSPKAQPFIKKGKKVKVGDVLFIIEAMKTMNQVKSDREGVVKKILVENGLPVEFNQDLVIIE
jgi:acetyl-CoA carboxylase biotin carboxyl carrier protein